MTKKIQILDCTLRDGGYANNWAFSIECITQTLELLNNSSIDYIECGFLTNNKPNISSTTLFSSIDELNSYLPSGIDITKTSLMLKIGEYDESKILPACAESCSTIRIIFKKYQINNALKCAKNLTDKGYKIFLNPTFITLYSEDEIKLLLDKVNEIIPFGFSLVDSIGCFDKNSLNKIIHTTDKILDEKITLCLHTHNSLQLSMANAQTFLESKLNRDIILDSTLYGMGRGAGNLRTEIIADYLNSNYSKTYNIETLYTLLDKYYYELYETYRWGFSLKYYLCAKLGLHTDYGYYLVKKCNISHSRASKILSLIPKEKREIFDENLIKSLVDKYGDKDFILTK